MSDPERFVSPSRARRRGAERLCLQREDLHYFVSMLNSFPTDCCLRLSTARGAAAGVHWKACLFFPGSIGLTWCITFRDECQDSKLISETGTVQHPLSTSTSQPILHCWDSKTVFSFPSALGNALYCTGFWKGRAGRLRKEARITSWTRYPTFKVIIY